MKVLKCNYFLTFTLQETKLNSIQYVTFYVFSSSISIAGLSFIFILTLN